MKIAIVGTRGIPNKYGGFEQFAMHFAAFLIREGHYVVVYNSSDHPYNEQTWKGVQIKKVFNPEMYIGSSGQFIFDFLTILDTRSKEFDVIFQLGYTSSSIWGFLFPKSAKLITNMDGLEWKRSKYGKITKRFLMKAEKWAVQQSDRLIADSKGIQMYLKEKYKVEAVYIPYGAEVFENPNEKVLNEFGLKKYKYNLAISRLEPENNLEIIIQGHIKANKTALLIVGSTATKHGKMLVKKYGDIVNFLGPIYDLKVLNNLRYFSHLYFHGHSVGGTNPSLLEAMACSCSIVAHKNVFNQSVLEENAHYFDCASAITSILNNHSLCTKAIENNLKKIKSDYSFDNIHHQLLKIIL